jgi:hypothetical protein
MNAHCERVIGTLRREVLDHLLIWNESHARRVLDAYARHYRRVRPPLQQPPPTPGSRTAPSPRPGAPRTGNRPDHSPTPTNPSARRRHQ